jgi:hypothetical protein
MLDGSKFSGSFKEGCPDKGDLVAVDGTSIAGKFNPGLRLQGRGSFTVNASKDFVEGVADDANRLVSKQRYQSFNLPPTRPFIALDSMGI